MIEFLVGVGFVCALSVYQSNILLGTSAVGFCLNLVNRQVGSVRWRKILVCIARLILIAVFIYYINFGVSLIALACLIACFMLGSVAKFVGDGFPPHAMVDTILGFILIAVAYGSFVHPQIRNEYGGGEPHQISIRYIEPWRTKNEEYKFTDVKGSLLHGTENMLYVEYADSIVFIKRENVVSISSGRPGWFEHLRNQSRAR